MGELRFAVATFKRVFEVTPRRDVLTLEELVRGLTTFALKPRLQARVERELSRLEQTYRAHAAGEEPSGRYAAMLRRARARGDGGEAAYEQLRRKIFARSKTDLRLWSPTLYRAGGRRGSEDVVHLSCLVLDYDAGATIEAASARWSDFFHVVHTTWSHTPERPKFRLVLPLAAPVLAEDWERVWGWAQRRAGGLIDSALKSPASTYALPATAGHDHPRRAFVARAPLLDAVALGLVPRAAAPPPQLERPDASHFRGDPDLTFVPAPPEEAPVSPEDFDLFGSSAEAGDGIDDEFDLF